MATDVTDVEELPKCLDLSMAGDRCASVSRGSEKAEHRRCGQVCRLDKGILASTRSRRRRLVCGKCHLIKAEIATLPTRAAASHTPPTQPEIPTLPTRAAASPAPPT